MQKVFGIGWAKTGTTTLGKCFQILGYKHQGQRLGLVPDLIDGNFKRTFALASQKESFEDWPWIILYPELDKKFPGSKFVLTQRDTSRWIRSYKNMVKNLAAASEKMNAIRSYTYGLPFPHVNEAELIARYEKHNAEVKEYFSSRPDDLLLVNWEEDSSWNKLCEFLGKDIPTEEFPHANKGIYKQPKA